MARAILSALVVLAAAGVASTHGAHGQVQSGARLEPLFDKIVVNPAGKYSMEVEVVNECEWEQQATIEWGVQPGTGAGHYTNEVGLLLAAKSSRTVSYQIESRDLPLWVAAEITHQEARRGPRICDRLVSGKTAALSWAKDDRVPLSGVVPVEGQFVLTQRVVLLGDPPKEDVPTSPLRPEAGQTRDVVPATPPSRPTPDVEYPSIPVPGANPPAVDDDTAFEPAASSPPTGPTASGPKDDSSRYDFSGSWNAEGTEYTFYSMADEPEVTKVSPGRNASGVTNPLIQNKAIDFDAGWTRYELNDSEFDSMFRFSGESNLPTDRERVVPPSQSRGSVRPQDLFATLLRGATWLMERAVPTVYADAISAEQATKQGGLVFLIGDAGGSTGRTIALQALNLTGRPVRLSGALAVEPLTQSAQKAALASFTRLARDRMPTALRLNAFCLEFAKLPPAAGQLMRLASPEAQRRLAPLKRIMSAANTLTQSGSLKPDSTPATYADSIKQWAVWTSEQKFNERKFAEAFMSHTRKNLEAGGQRWSKQVEDIVKQRTPNRWNDVVSILKAAGAAIPQ